MTDASGDLSVTEVPVGPEARTLRLYAPAGGAARGLLVFAHGGGFSWGGLDDYDRICRNLAAATLGLVAAVDYRLAPGHRFPAALDDLREAFLWAAARRGRLAGPDAPLILAGDSAGGCLAAALCHRLRAEGGPRPDGQLLIYPMIEHHARTPAGFHDLARRFPPSHADIRGAWDGYLAHDGEADNPFAVPARADDLSGLPPACVVTAGNDPLRVEGEAYARRLAGAGVPVRARCFDGVGHSFLGEPPGAPRVAEAMAEIGAWAAALPGRAAPEPALARQG